MRIQYVVTGLDVGGAEVQVRDLAVGMKARGHDVTVTSLLRPNAYVDRLASAGIQVRTLNIKRRNVGIASLVRAAWTYRQGVRKLAPDVVHAHMVHANIFARLSLAFSKTPVICTVHSMDEGGRARDAAYVLTNWASTLNSTISEAATKRFLDHRVLPRSTITVHNGVDTSEFWPAASKERSSAPFRWIAVGRLEAAKDYASLLRAVAQLPNITLDIAGAGSSEDELKALSHALDLEARVTFLGTREGIPALLRQYDAYVLSSTREGFGIAIVEAMASGLPVVVTDAGGPAEIVGRDGGAGLVVPPGDEHALAAAMRSMSSMAIPELRAMGKRGRERAVNLFDLKVALDRWESVYEEVAR